MDTNYWRLVYDDYVAAVDEKTARDVVKQYENGNKIISFFDLFGGEVLFPASEFKGTWHSSETSRTASAEFYDAMEAEAKARKSWD